MQYRVYKYIYSYFLMAERKAKGKQGAIERKEKHMDNLATLRNEARAKNLAPVVLDNASVGRPSKYKPEYCEDIIKFFSVPTHRTVDYETEGGRLISKDVANPFPTFEKFACSLGVLLPTLYYWASKFPEFSHAYKRAKALQKNFLVQNALSGLYSPAFSIFLAKNITDLRDVKEHNVNTNLSFERKLDDKSLDVLKTIVPNVVITHDIEGESEEDYEE